MNEEKLIAIYQNLVKISRHNMDTIRQMLRKSKELDNYEEGSKLSTEKFALFASSISAHNNNGRLLVEIEDLANVITLDDYSIDIVGALRDEYKMLQDEIVRGE